MPLYTGLIAKALGARDVVLIDARTHVRRQAHDLGFAALAPDQAGRLAPAPLVADISATRAGLRLALNLTATAPDGICSSSGSLQATTRIPAALMFGRNITLTVARAHARALIPDVLRLMTQQSMRPELVTTAIAPMDGPVSGRLLAHAEVGWALGRCRRCRQSCRQPDVVSRVSAEAARELWRGA